MLHVSLNLTWPKGPSKISENHILRISDPNMESHYIDVSAGMLFLELIRVTSALLETETLIFELNI